MRADLDEVLKDAPTAIRRAIIDDKSALAPGAAQVMAGDGTEIERRQSNMALD